MNSPPSLSPQQATRLKVDGPKVKSSQNTGQLDGNVSVAR
jgi:hypothetical protein